MSDLVAITALIVSVLAAVITYWQTKLVRQTIESQTFTTLLERAREIDISATLDFIGTLRYTDYESYQNSVPQEKQAHIRAVVDFFNDLSHMIRGGYIDDFYPIRIYQPALFTCHQRLLSWWLDGIRASRYPTLYENFSWLCQYGNYLESEMSIRKLSTIPKIGYRKFLKSRGVT